MKIIKRASDNTVLFAGDDLTLDPNGCGGPGWRHKGVTSNNAIMDEISALPDAFEPGQWTYAGGVWTATDLVNNTLLNNKKTSKIDQLKMAYDASVFSNIEHDGKIYPADKETQALLTQILAVGSVPQGMYWRDIAGTENLMSFAELQSLATAMLTRGVTADSNLTAKISDVNAAATLQDVDGVTW